MLPTFNPMKKTESQVWRRWYVGVGLWLVAQVVFYYLFTQHYK
jgi:hypothetical protein